MLLALSVIVLPYTYLSFLFLFNLYCPIYKKFGVHFSFYEVFYYFQGLIYIMFFFILKFNDHDAATVQQTHKYHQQRREYQQQKNALVKACLHKIHYQQMKSNWTEFTYQEYLIGSLICIIVIIPVTILLLSTSLPVGLPYTLTILVAAITLLHIVWGVFDVYDTTSQYNIYIRLVLGLIFTTSLVTPLFLIQRIYHLVYVELSTIVYTILILMASYIRGRLGYKLYPVDNLYIRDLLPHTDPEQKQYYQRYANQSHQKTQQQEFYTSYYYQNGHIINTIYDEDFEAALPSQFYQNPYQIRNQYAARTLYPLDSSPDLIEDDENFNVPIYNQEDKEENSLRLIQVMRVSCIVFGLFYILLNILYGSTAYMSVCLILLILFFFSSIFKNVHKLKGMLVYWSTLFSVSLFLLFLLNMPFFIHSKKYPNLVMRIDQSLTEELPLLNRTTVSGFYIQNQVN